MSLINNLRSLNRTKRLIATALFSVIYFFIFTWVNIEIIKTNDFWSALPIAFLSIYFIYGFTFKSDIYYGLSDMPHVDNTKTKNYSNEVKRFLRLFAFLFGVFILLLFVIRGIRP